MEITRIILFLGLVLHKAVWEILKRKNRNPDVQRGALRTPVTRLIKFVKVMVLLFLIVQTLFLNVLPMSANNPSLRIAGLAIFFLGLAIAITARINIGKNWIDLEDYQVLPKQSLITNGAYHFIRHPIYVGDFLLMVGLELALQSWLVLGVALLIPVIIRQALAEEALLSKVFPQYGEYRARTNRFIPFVI
jgi:Putative protein-S-isoprenylcysteine methyltransferase